MVWGDNLRFAQQSIKLTGLFAVFGRNQIDLLFLLLCCPNRITFCIHARLNKSQRACDEAASDTDVGSDWELLIFSVRCLLLLLRSKYCTLLQSLSLVKDQTGRECRKPTALTSHELFDTQRAALSQLNSRYCSFSESTDGESALTVDLKIFWW